MGRSHGPAVEVPQYGAGTGKLPMSQPQLAALSSRALRHAGLQQVSSFSFRSYSAGFFRLVEAQGCLRLMPPSLVGNFTMCWLARQVACAFRMAASGFGPPGYCVRCAPVWAGMGQLGRVNSRNCRVLPSPPPGFSFRSYSAGFFRRSKLRAACSLMPRSSSGISPCAGWLQVAVVPVLRRAVSSVLG